MKKVFLFLNCLTTFLLLSQGNSSNEHYVKKNEVIVRVNPNLLLPSFIDDETKHEGKMLDFFHPVGKEHVKKIKKLPFNVEKVRMEKIFTHSKRCDKFSISRGGKQIAMPPFWATFILKIPNGFDLQEVITALKGAYPVILYAHPNYFVEKEQGETNDQLFDTLQHSLNSTVYPNAHINVDSAWQIETGKKFIKVGVFDTGINDDHEDLEILAHSLFPGEEENEGNDYRGHGTAVAGIIGAKRNNNKGIAGIAGGDGSDTSGVSMIDFGFSQSEFTTNVSFLCTQIIDAARSVDSYYDWNDVVAGCENAQAYGIHIGNHSYKLWTRLFNSDQNIVEPGDTILWVDEVNRIACDLCVESFLFSMKSGVVNVVARGNSRTNLVDETLPKGSFPQVLDDSWIISVGASGSDGKRAYGPNNTSANEVNFASAVGQNIDLIAPGTELLVHTTSSKNISGDSTSYTNFNGTSAAAPHVSGVVALLLSRYNKNCYSNINLDPADVEYILQKSATDVHSVAYDDSSGWGRLNAHKALKMIDFPSLQIVHPTEAPINIEVLDNNTTIMYLNTPLTDRNINPNDLPDGPLSSVFNLRNERFYEVERLHFQLTYSFSNPYFSLPTTKILDTWVRHSQTNSLSFTADSTMYLAPVGTTGNYEWTVAADTISIVPMANITQVDSINKTISLDGYYYHFTKMFNDKFSVLNNVFVNEDFWYPINPNLEHPKMAYSIYLQDPNLTQRYDFPCDSANPLLDYDASIKKTNINDFSLYPNPGENKINIQVLNVLEDSEIRLYEMNGTLALKKQIRKAEQKVEMDTEKLEGGIYLIELSNKQQKIIKKWVKI